MPGPRWDELRDQPDASAPTTSASRRIDTSSEWFLPTVNLLGLIAVIAFALLANVVPLNGQTTVEVLADDPVYVQPTDWTFAVIGLLALLLVAFAVYLFLPHGRRDRRMRFAATVLLMSHLALVLWLVMWHFEQWSASVILMSLLAASLLVIHSVLRQHRSGGDLPSATERFMVWTPFSVYFGAVVFAVVVNLTVAMDRTGSELWSIGPRWWAVLMLVVLVLATASMTLLRHDPAFALVISWSTLGVAVEQWDRSMLVAISAMLAALLVAALTIVAVVMAYERRLLGHVLPQAIPARMRRSKARHVVPGDSTDDDNRNDGVPRT
jgi:hypothetical protein